MKIVGPKECEFSMQDLEERTGVRFAPFLEFASLRLKKKLSRKIEKKHRKGQLMQKQLWLGSYFARELSRPEEGPFLLKWIEEISGFGVFAAKEYQPFEWVAEYTGEVRRKRWRDGKNAYCFEYLLVAGQDSRYVIDAQKQGGIARFINHSACPNLMSALATWENQNRVILYTKRKIAKGEQLCYDYGDMYWKRRASPVSF